MTQTLLQRDREYSFSLEPPYDSDIWHVCEWDLYNNATKDQQSAWISRTNIMNNTMDFTLCNIPLIREESKYFVYKLLSEKNISLRTFAEYTDRFKLLFKYVNENNCNSVLSIDVTSFESFMITTNHKAIIGNGNSVLGKEIVPAQKQNRIISFVSTMQRSIADYIDSTKPLYERDFWYGKEINPETTEIANFDFSNISQPLIKHATKEYIKFKLDTVELKTAHVFLRNIKIFAQWLANFDESISSFKDVTRDTLESYFLFLRTEAEFSQHKLNLNILHLCNIFEWGIVSENDLFPQNIIFLPEDYYFKTKRRTEFYSNEEIASLFKIAVPKLPKVYGRILLILHHGGMRISEVLRMKKDALKEKDGKYYLSNYMYKTHRYNNIPLDDYIYNIIKQELAYGEKKYPNAKYIFSNSDGSPISYSSFITNIKTVIIKENIFGSNGKLLEFGTHKFRATKATNLINMGEDPKIAADMLGHKSLDSLSYYAVAKNQALNEQMQEYLRKESILINSIGKMDSLAIEDYKNAVALCNGWCCKPIELGVCDKVDVCISCSLFKPSSQYLLNYKLQLADVESALIVAKENGYTRMIEKCEQQKSSLEEIIKKVEEKLNEQKT